MSSSLVIGIVVFFVLIVLFMGLHFMNAKKADARCGAKQRNYSGPDDSRSAAAVLNEPVEQVAEDMETIDCLALRIPSPERPATEVDAVMIDLIRQAFELPSAVLELSQLLQDPDAGARKVAELASTDPVLSARLLRVANSAAVGTGRIKSLQQAIVLLGFNQVWILVNQMLTARSMQPLATFSDDAMQRLWKHAAAVSVCAKHLLIRLGHAGSPVAPVVMTSALLHDVGKFLLRGLQPVGNGRSDFAEQDKETVVPPVLEENTVYGIDHCRIGFLLTTYWKLPDEICSTIAYHHHISFANWKDVPSHVRTPVTLVAASDYLANIAGFYEAGPVTYRIPEHIRIFPGFSRPLHTLLEKDLRKDLARTEMLIDQTISES
ncbi:MAG TPA: HDOD domain-containing protein [Thermodesulfobacteriaceae bacterium]|nr:HDOD domain-containing protein [Thermodesulfobacteriaceae bacterium]